MLSRLRPFLVIVCLLAGVWCARAQEYSVNAGEIRFDGAVAQVKSEAGVLIISVESFTLPSGKNSKLPAPKPKTIVVEAGTLLQVQGDAARKLTLPQIAPGQKVIVIGKDTGSGKDVPARLVAVAMAEAEASNPASTPKTPEGSDPNEVALRAGETRFDGKITGILSTTNFTVSVYSATAAGGETEELMMGQSKTVLLDDATILRSRGDVARKLSFNDLKIGQRVTFAGKDTGSKNVKAREIAVWEADASASESIGSVTVSPAVSLILNQADQAYEARAYEEAIKIINRGLQVAGDDRGGRGLLYDRLGSAYGELGQPQKALAAYESALAVWRGAGDSQSESTTLNNLGILLDSLGEAEKAVTTLERAVQLSRGGDPRGMALTLQNLAGAYISAEKPDKALEALLEALPFVRKTRKTTDDEAILLARVAHIYGMTNKPEKVREYAGQAAPLIEQITDKGQQAYALYTLGNAYALAAQKSKAIEYYKRAHTQFADLGAKEEAENVQKSIAALENPAAQNAAAENPAAQNDGLVAE